MRAIIGLLKKPFTIFCQSELKEIQNAFPVIHLVRLGPIRIKGNSKRISGNSFSPFGAQNKHRVFSHDVTAAILVFQNNERAAILVYQDNPVGVELFSYAYAFFGSNEFA